MQDSTARELLEEERARLTASRERLQSELDTAQDDTQGHRIVLDQPADQVAQLTVREEDASLILHLDEALRDVDDALQRVEDGTYGTCQVDGAPIDEDRLQARPAARYCLVHEQEQEQLSSAERGPGT